MWHNTGSSYENINDNYSVNPTTIASVDDVVRNDIQPYTANFAQGNLYKESTHSERPDPNQQPTGWIIYLVLDNTYKDWAIEQYLNDNQGDIYNGGMNFKQGEIFRSGVSIDTAQTLGIGQQHNTGEVMSGTMPSPKAKMYGKIIYSRAPHHRMWGGIDDEV